MGRNSKDNSLARYETMLQIVVNYYDYLQHPKIRFSFSSSSRKQRNHEMKFVRNVKEALASLNKDERFIIQNEFFERKSDKFWWEKFYSKSTYYRRRNFAIKSFMEHFEQ